MLTIQEQDYSRLYVAVRSWDKDLGKAVRKRLTEAAAPARDAVRSAALGLPSTGGGTEAWRKKRGVAGGASLRQGIAAATEIKVMPARPDAFMIRVRVSGTKFRAATGKPLTLPRYMEGQSRRPWRHPVFGNTNVWVVQPSRPYLIPTVARFKGEAKAAVERALTDAIHQLQRRFQP